MLSTVTEASKGAIEYVGGMSNLQKKNEDIHSFVMKYLSGKNITKGEQVLLAKAISDTITLSPDCCSDFSMWFLQQKDFIKRVTCFVRDYALGVNEEQVIQLVKNFTEWRARVAFSPPNLTFNKGQDYMIDELTGVLFYVDQGTLCSFADRYPNASTFYSSFRKIAIHVKTGA